MRKLTKRALSSIMAIILTVLSICSIESTIFADEFVSYEQDNNDIYTYIDTVLPNYLSISSCATDNISLSEPVILHDWNDASNDKTIFFIINDGDLFAQLTVDEINGKYFSSFTTSDYLEIVNQNYKVNKSVAIGNYDGDLILYDGNNITTLISDNNILDNDIKEDVALLSNIYTSTMDCIEIGDYSVETTSIKPRTAYYSVEAPFVANITNSVDGIGLCWAACVASIANYKNNYSLTTQNVFDDCWNSVGCNPNNVPVGTVSWTTTALSLEKVSLFSSSTPLSGNSVVSAIKDKNPVLLYMTTSNRKNSHDVVIKGVVSNNTYGFYYLMDPNVSSGDVLVSVDSSAWSNGSNFTYTSPSGTTYTSWVHSWS